MAPEPSMCFFQSLMEIHLRCLELEDDSFIVDNAEVAGAEEVDDVAGKAEATIVPDADTLVDTRSFSLDANLRDSVRGLLRVRVDVVLIATRDKDLSDVDRSQQ